MAIYSLRHAPVGRTTHRAGTAGAHARYIMRPEAASLVIGEHMPTERNQARTWLDEQEAGERKNARVIDKLTIALPVELTPEQRREAVEVFARSVTEGRAPWVAAIHDQGKDAHNPHAHVIIRDRDIETGRRVAQLSEKGSTERMRELWENAGNLALERAGRPERIDRRTLEAQGIEREAQIHVGPKAKAMEARGAAAESRARTDHRGRVIDYPEIDQGRSRAERNAEIIDLNAERARRAAGTRERPAEAAITQAVVRETPGERAAREREQRQETAQTPSPAPARRSLLEAASELAGRARGYLTGLVWGESAAGAAQPPPAERPPPALPVRSMGGRGTAQPTGAPPMGVTVTLGAPGTRALDAGGKAAEGMATVLGDMFDSSGAAARERFQEAARRREAEQAAEAPDPGPEERARQAAAEARAEQAAEAERRAREALERWARQREQERDGGRER